MKIVVYGLTITSSWGNGHATTYRSLLKALARRGHTVHFVERDAEWYRSNRDMPRPEFCTVHLYDDWKTEGAQLTRLSADADVVVVGSYFPDAKSATRDLLEKVQCPILFYDIDTPITMRGLRENGGTEYLDAATIPCYAAYLSFTGGPALAELEDCFGARQAVAFFCSVDPDVHRPTPPRPEFTCDLSYLGTYAPDRQRTLMHLLDGTAGLLPCSKFLVGGSQYPDGISWRPNVSRLVHIPPPDHPAFYSSSRFTLNVTRRDMIAAGFSPSVRLFEASACESAIISDSWPGLPDFLTPGEEIIVPRDEVEVAAILTGISDEQRQRIGQRARARVLAEHTAEHRASEFERIVASCGTLPVGKLNASIPCESAIPDTNAVAAGQPATV